MSARQLFISDLHLEANRPDITRTLQQFLVDNHGRCSDLFILGDLFEVWIGDDEDSPLAGAVATALHQFSAGGSRIHLMHGNRDFLLGTAYAARCGATLIHEPYTLDSPAGTLLLMHGDSLCTDDTDYQQFRTLVRAPAWQQEFLARPLADRRAFAEQARQQSRSATAHKAMDIMDVNAQAVVEQFQDGQYAILLHGHTHRPDVHRITLASGNEVTRLVLGSWEKAPWYAVCENSGIHLRQLPLLAA